MKKKQKYINKYQKDAREISCCMNELLCIVQQYTISASLIALKRVYSDQMKLVDRSFEIGFPDDVTKREEDQKRIKNDKMII